MTTTLQLLLRQSIERAGEIGLADGATRLLVWMILESIPGIDGPVFCRGRDSLLEGLGRQHDTAGLSCLSRRLAQLRRSGLIDVIEASHTGSPTFYRIRTQGES